MIKQITIGGRSSQLSQWQINFVKDALLAQYPGLGVKIAFQETRGDRIQNVPLPEIGGKGVFTEEVERALRSGAIDIAVHSLKDLPVQDPEGLVLCAIPKRGPVGDVLISKSRRTLDALPKGATIGTSSIRRKAQLIKHRPDLNFADIRGNLNTRIKKAMDPNGVYDAIILAEAGVRRMGWDDKINEVLDPKLMMPAPGQGALAIQCSKDRQDVMELLEFLEDAITRAATNSERSFLAGLGGGCSLPISAMATHRADNIHLSGRVNSADGKEAIDVQGENGIALAQKAIEKGAQKLLGIQK